MSVAEARMQMTVRLRIADKQFFAAGTAACGIEASIAARQILELVILRMRAGGDFLDAVHELKSAWGVPTRDDQIQREMSAAVRSLGEFKSPEEQDTILERIERLEREVQAQHHPKPARA
jgi:hypothetical protein